MWLLSGVVIPPPRSALLCWCSAVGTLTRGCAGDAHSRPRALTERLLHLQINWSPFAGPINACFHVVYSLTTLYGENLSFVRALTCDLYVCVLMLHIQTLHNVRRVLLFRYNVWIICLNRNHCELSLGIGMFSHCLLWIGNFVSRIESIW